MEVQATNTKHAIGLTISSFVVIAVLFLTICFTGHAKAGGVLFIGVLFNAFESERGYAILKAFEE